MRTPLIGAAYAARSLNLAAQQMVNLYPEVVEVRGAGAAIGALYGTPGLTKQATVGPGPIRGMRVVAGTLYIVSGVGVYSGLGGTLIGTLTTPITGAVQMIDNGTQLAIFDGAAGYLVSGGVLSSISLPFSGPTAACYQDGFGLVSAANTNQWYQSNIFDLSTWSALNFSSASGQPDNLLAMADIHREVWLFKQQHAEVWVNAGLAGFTFQRIDGVHIEHGIGAPASLAIADDSLIWLSQNSQGMARVMQSQGYRVSRLSTHALETALNGYTTISDAVGYTYQQEGHVFYVLSLPTAGVTWCCDLTSSAHLQFPCWHQRAGFSNGTFTIHPASCATVFNGLVLCGDCASGNIYSFDLSNYTDNGAQRRWLRSWRALAQPSEAPQRFSTLRIDMETGMGVPSGTAPECSLRWSDDGGHNWSNPVLAAVGPTGATAQRVLFRRLGSTRRNHGLDRIFELSSSDPFKVALIGAELGA